MPKVKYFDAVAKAIAQNADYAAGDLPPFDFNSIAATGFGARVKAALFRRLLQPVYAFSRRFMPVMPLMGVTHISRDADVRQVLAQPEVFRVPFGPEMKELAGGETFVLGLDGPAQQRQNAIIRAVIHPADDMALVGDLTRRFGSALLDNSAGRIDAMDDYLKRTVTEVCIRYFGFTVDDPDGFADWTISASALLFADPYGDPKVRALAQNGAVRLRWLIDDAVRRAKRHFRVHGSEGAQETLVDRLVSLQAEREGSDPISDAEIRAILYGLVTGFIPTNALAAGKMLEELLVRPKAFAMALDAAHGGMEGRKRMKRILLEAGRLSPALSPGQWRHCPQDAIITVDGKEKCIKAGTTLMVATMSAMRDKRVMPQPYRFWPDRTRADGSWAEPDLIFGDGVHQCLGKHLAIEQITEAFMVLFSRPGLRAASGKAGKMAALGPFPRHVTLTFNTPAAKQSMFLVIAPVRSGVDKAIVDAQIAALGNPAGHAIRQALDETDILHFASISTIESERGLDIVCEISADGAIHAVLRQISERASALLRPLFALADLRDAEDLATCMGRHVVELHGKPWGANGLNYNGLPEFPVRGIARQERFARFVSLVLDDWLVSNAASGSHARLAMTHVRRILNQDRILARSATPAQKALMQEARAEGFDAYRVMPRGAALHLSAFRPGSKIGSFITFLTAREAVVFWLPPVLVLGGFMPIFWSDNHWLLAGLKALVATALALGVLVTGFFLAIRRAEKKDWIDRTEAGDAKLRAVAAMENAPGHVMNHVMAVGEMKPGYLRAFAHAFSLWAIRMLITFHFRPGFVINMGTIQYARWWRLPGSSKTIFYSNYDGSWESYLEDFITRARWGQTAAWSNWKGFPETRFLMFAGAQDGDAFKRWVRVRQQIVPFWYARFPQLTTDRIRANALIHSGVARAQSESEAEDWLRCFGSMPRIENRIETDEVQALVFSGLKPLTHSTTMVLRLPPEAAQLGEWLDWVRGNTMTPQSHVDPQFSSVLDALKAEGIIVPVPGTAAGQDAHALAHSLTITFGDRPLMTDAGGVELDITDSAEAFARQDSARAGRRAVFLALSATGLARIDAPNMADGALASRFPGAFRMGMAARARVLGDEGDQAPDRWSWHDGTAEAVLLVYAESAEDLAIATLVHRALLENHGGSVIAETACAPAFADRPEHEHFGFRDGIAQPVITGTTRAARGVPARDLVEPGEFILGYKNGPGYYPPAPVLPAAADPRAALPEPAGDLSRFPDFGALDDIGQLRDFGRNGSFLVLRELAQDVDGFHAFAEAKAAELRGDARRDLYKVLGQVPDADWVKAKIMGRWPDGRPLVGNPVNKPADQVSEAAATENDFSFGVDDPQGLACPLGSHIRRTNPRDSKMPGDVNEQAISNRHRLLRRGRTFARPDGKGGLEKGLMFVALCTDIERQFEFVQQVWVNAGGFHGLVDEPDPVMGTSTAPRCFTIPTAAGPLRLSGMQSFVKTVAGGYFFLPSRSALGWMADAALHNLPDPVEPKADPERL